MLSNFKFRKQIRLFFSVLLAVLCFTIINYAYSLTKYSNVIIFGDSQSDIGNFPQSQTAYGVKDNNGNRSFTFNNYVPIANPEANNSIKILPGLNIQVPPFQNSQTFTQTLPPKSIICNNAVFHVSCSFRRWHSLNWVAYFMYNATLLKVIGKNPDVRPWIVQYEQTINTNKRATIKQSVDYAWVGAMTPDICSDVNQERKRHNCGINKGITLSQALYSSQHRYRYNQVSKSARINDKLQKMVLIPGAEKQIELFLRDKIKRRVITNRRTLFIVWTGANDIGYKYSQLGGGLRFIAYLLMVLPKKIAGSSNQNSVVGKLIQVGAKNILVIGQYNLGLNPKYYSSKTAGIFNFLTSIYNNILKNRVSKWQLAGYNVHYVDIQNPINKYIKGNDPLFKQTLGQSCDAISQMYNGQEVSCYKKSDSANTFGWWNGSHLATQLNQVVASVILQAAYNAS